MRTAKQRLVALTLVLATVLGLGAVTPVTAIAAPACASELGLRPPSSEATAETPAVLLHGLWGDVDSMLAMSQSLESTKTVVPYRFDYKSANTAWVTVGDAAQRLARTIVCYSRMYGGKDVIIVAHSMGGLLAREALSRAAYGTFAKDVTGHVITIGTPHKGAPMGGGSYASNISLCDATFVWWGKEAADACNTIESAKAVSAMRPGSPELAALPRFPDGISVHAIAGDVRTARCMFLVCSPAFSTGGDLVVPIDSATDRAAYGGTDDGHKVFECFDAIAVANVSNPWCGHNGMLGAPQVQDNVKASIEKNLASVKAAANPLPTLPPHQTVTLFDKLELPYLNGWSTSTSDRHSATIEDGTRCDLSTERCPHFLIYTIEYLPNPGYVPCWEGYERRPDDFVGPKSVTVGGKPANYYQERKCTDEFVPDKQYTWIVPGQMLMILASDGDDGAVALDDLKAVLANIRWIK